MSSILAGMILLMHILVAVSGLIFSGLAFISPSRLKLRISYGLLTLTLASGTYLVISVHAPMLQACLSGLAYSVAILFGLIPARAKLARAELNSGIRQP